jgi:hypothetical protein
MLARMGKVKSKRALWKRFGRFSSALIVACFFLPFFGVSCQGLDVVTASGADMVGGCRPGGMLAAADDQQRSHGGMASSGGSADVKIENVDREPLAIAAMAACVALLALSFLSTRGALVGCLLLAIAALGSLGGLYGKMKHKMNDDIAEASKSKMTKEGDIDAGSRFGLWLVALGLVGTAAVTGLALREKDQSADAAG